MELLVVTFTYRVICSNNFQRKENEVLLTRWNHQSFFFFRIFQYLKICIYACKWDWRDLNERLREWSMEKDFLKQITFVLVQSSTLGSEISEIFNQYPESRLHFENSKGTTNNKNFILQFYSDNKFHFPRAQSILWTMFIGLIKRREFTRIFLLSGSWLSRPEVVSFHFFFFSFMEKKDEDGR